MTDSFDSTLGEKVRRARRARGFGLMDLSYAVSIAHDRLCRCERGDERFSTVELFRIARMLRVNPAYLLGAEQPRKPPCRATAGIPANDNDNDRLRLAESLSELLAELGAALQPAPPPENRT